MNINVLFYSIAYALRLDSILWCLLAFLLSFLLWLMVFLIISQCVTERTGKALTAGIAGIWTSQAGTIITTVAIPAHFMLFARSQMPKIAASTLSMTTLLTVALLTILTTMLFFLISVAIKVKAEIGALEGLIRDNFRQEPVQTERQEWSIPEHKSYQPSFNTIAYYMTIASIIVLISGLISSVGFPLGAGVNKPTEYRSDVPGKTNVNVHADAWVYTYQTEDAWGDITEWHSTPDLSFAINSGNGAVPATLAWTDQQGNVASISFQTDMSSFFGYFQKPNEGPIAYRGILLGKIPLIQQANSIGAAKYYTYQTENAWGDITEWHSASNLSFAINSGNGAVPTTLKWTDQQGNAASISFQTDMSSFFGYFQKPNEGPIAYQGTLL
jgi:hypothetical protein